MTACLKKKTQTSVWGVEVFNLYPMNAPDPFKSVSYERTKWVRGSHLNAPHIHV